MKKIVIITLACLMLCVGCASTQSNQSQTTNVGSFVNEANTRTVVRLGTYIALEQGKMKSEDIAKIRDVFVAANGFLSSDKPDFTGVRNLITKQLTKNQQIVAATIVDLIEGNLNEWIAKNPLNNDAVKIKAYVGAAVSGVIQAIDMRQTPSN